MITAFFYYYFFSSEPAFWPFPKLLHRVNNALNSKEQGKLNGQWDTRVS